MGKEYKSNRISHIRRSEITCDSYLQTSSIDSPLSEVDLSKWVFVSLCVLNKKNQAFP